MKYQSLVILKIMRDLLKKNPLENTHKIFRCYFFVEKSFKLYNIKYLKNDVQHSIDILQLKFVKRIQENLLKSLTITSLNSCFEVVLRVCCKYFFCNRVSLGFKFGVLRKNKNSHLN